ncbi:tRNA (guanine-N(7)-)-methyltransferase TrmB [Gottschalkia acidurici 9a]|uniref:tRNA (guanine-N(7)-)-methyltransferase n=1 Tax=Gottschalkia acidurici (strain ATCC 7906 / DSM 604 / BCRC 14475 / CIP 104303 / KCTC 5404 / NCIMB 10678 / 9a) TaxID=1128398 RepID=K0AW14_GOTA9|nr:tRNA (guanosine(46)-N7)-methyltransferase TrmB [Gottschalkia acidurici]AFS78078.1 tRNA (guanine-N(7)-)-methyltransferase TrmB [Gottschalkia acidurici 9a]
MKYETKKKPGSKEKLLGYKELVITNPQENKGKWKEYLGTEKIHIELGTGRGKFINSLAEQNGEIFHIGIEIKEEVLLNAVEKAHNNSLKNLKFMWTDINNIDEIFDTNEIDRIYINFCDPWPKTRHSRRRLTHRSFLEKYKEILKSDGEIHFKTDNEELFEFSLNEISDSNLKLKDIYLDLYRDKEIETTKTEYEEKFIDLGKKYLV